MPDVSRPSTWLDRIDALAREHPELTALIVTGEAGERLSWRDLSQRSASVAKIFAERGVRQGSTVVIRLPNSVAFVVAALAAWRLGGTVLPLRWDMPAPERERLIALAKPALVVSEAGDGEISAAEVTHAPPLDPAALPPPMVAKPAWLIASGGSTGTPKLIAPDVDTILAPGGMRFPGTRSHFANNEDHRHPTHLVCAPLYHTHGFLLTFRTLTEDFRVVLMPRFDAEQFLDLVERERVNFFAIVPTMLIRILRSESLRARDFSSVETAILGAAATPEWAIRQWIDVIGDRLLMGYGMSEGIGASFIRGSEWLAHPGSSGKPIGVETLIANEAGEPLPSGEVGEIYFKPLEGEHAFRYVGASPMRTLPGGWASVGDLGKLDADGYLYIVDRRADMIVTGGANVFVSEVEAAVLAHPDVADTAVVGIADPEWGRRVHAIVRPRPDTDLAELPGSIRAHCKGLLASYKVPRTIEFVDDLGRSEAGKLNRQALARARESNS
jgi:bile acid-coenzyme A ligase